MKVPQSTSSHADLMNKIDALAHMNRNELVSCWQQQLKQPVPRRSAVPLMRQILAWQMQAAHLGGLTAIDRRRLHHGRATVLPKLAIGSQLVRVWQGQTHHVTIWNDGFEYAGHRWRSLSGIAKAITGTPWSGPKFFGLHDLADES